MQCPFSSEVLPGIVMHKQAPAASACRCRRARTHACGLERSQERGEKGGGAP